jgi:hypothetical protein
MHYKNKGSEVPLKRKLLFEMFAIKFIAQNVYKDLHQKITENDKHTTSHEESEV